MQVKVLQWLFIALPVLLLSCSYSVPILSQGELKFDNEYDRETITVRKDVDSLMLLVTDYVRGIVEEEPGLILRQVHPQKGALVDLKAQVSKAEAGYALNQGILYQVYWQGSEESASFQKLLGRVSEAKVDFHFYNDTACEVSLQFENRPSLGIMSNAIYHRYDGTWYLARFL